MPRLVLKLTA
jgi:hypothetical protein